MASLVVILLLVLAGNARGEPCLLPAYAHNDYENERPLAEAIELGYRGVEVDFYLLDGELCVAHDRNEIRPGRTIEALYLAPLRERIARLGSVHYDGSPFVLNIESKEEGREGYEALRDLLIHYEDILTVVRDGVEAPGAVHVILVGWQPSVEELLAERVRYVSIQRHLNQLEPGDAELPAHLLRLISVEYRTLFRWGGRHRPTRRFMRGLTRIRELRDSAPGRIVRVFRAPRLRSVYKALLEGGVDLIGVKDIARARTTLLDLVPGCE